EGFEVAVTPTSREGIEKATAWKPDIILLDVMMPEMDGFLALSIIKGMKELADIPVVMLTNLSGEENRAYALQKGATEYFIKSDIENKNLVGAVRDIIQSFQKGKPA